MTDFHSKYWAHALTLKNASSSVRNLSRSIANARVDLNPHQVHAALFALQSPLSKGAILADEVGLGKTIEAGLVIAQKWAEKRRHILLIVPAFLRKQWEQELAEKFFLPITILDAKSFQHAQSAKGTNPFLSDEKVVICSYQFAVEKEGLISEVKWDLAVIDEAHRLRNVYKSGNKQARTIADALKERPKLLLTATPLQNNLMELFGLISVIDPFVFGDEGSFKQQFVLSKDEDSRNRELKARISPFVVRTLRKQVREYIPFTNRAAITQKFDPSDDEQRLYEGISSYLQRDALCALPNSQRELITLILRKLLASSSFAIAHTLRALIARLEKQASPQALLDPEEMEFLETISQEWKEEPLQAAQDDETKKQQSKIREELLELRTYVELAEKIRTNSKGEALASALKEAFDRAQQLGAAQKAVIFTESKRTQTYLYDLLSSRGYQDQIVLINGSNSDSSSKAIYEEWLKNQPKGSLGSRAVDMKAALVHHFRNKATILLATEAAAEGINLQFCSLVVNYDLPWNPQRIEQRIGRCHRYGQKHDVVVVNFLNTKNEADRRVFELLDEKFHLFSGVFGASDEVLGAVESGVDIEKRIHAAYQTCRTSEEIKIAFDTLQHELDEQIQAKLNQTRESIFDHFDEEVSSRLKMRKNETESSLNEREQWLTNLAYHELGLPIPTKPSFALEGTDFFLNWRHAEENGGTFFREEDPFAQKLITQALCRPLPPHCLEFDYSSYPNKISCLESLAGQSGWLELSRLRIETYETEEFLVLSALTDSGEELDIETCEKIFHLQARAISSIDPKDSPQQLSTLKEKHQQKYAEQVEAKASGFYLQEERKLDSWAEDLKLGLEKQLKEIEKEIKAARRAMALSKTLPEKLEQQKKIKNLESQRTMKRRSLFSEQDRIELQRDDLIMRLEKKLKQSVTHEQVFIIRWSIK
jgi:adenine-specific DNA-methyltransferase